MKKIVIICLVVCVIMLPLVYSAKVPKAFSEDTVNISTSIASCKLEFTYSVVNHLAQYKGNMSIWQEKLSEDREKLSNGTLGANATLLREFIKETLDPNLKQIREDVLRQRRIIFLNLTKEKKQIIRSNYSESLKEYNNCNNVALDKLVQKRLDDFNDVLESYDKEIIKLKAKNLSVEGLQNIINSARITIIEPYERDLQLADTPLEYNNLAKKYCLFNGCQKIIGTNYHLSAKFELAKLDAVILKLKNEWLADSASISESEKHVKVARDILNNEVGNTSYSGTEHARIWNSIKSAYSSLSIARDELGGLKK